MSIVLAHPWAFLLTSLAAVPCIVVASAALTTVWFERVWVPRIAGED